MLISTENLYICRPTNLKIFHFVIFKRKVQNHDYKYKKTPAALYSVQSTNEFPLTCQPILYSVYSTVDYCIAETL